MAPRHGVNVAWKWAAPAVLLTCACNQCLGYFATFCKMAKQTILCSRKEVNGELRCRHLISCSYTEIRTQPESLREGRLASLFSHFFNSYLCVPEVHGVLLGSSAGPLHRTAFSLRASICMYGYAAVLFLSLSLILPWFYSPIIMIQLHI